MGLFKRKKALSMKEKLLIEAKINKEKQQLQQKINKIEQSLKTERQVIKEAELNQSTEQKNASIALIEVFETRLSRLLDIKHTMVVLQDDLDDLETLKALLKSLSNLEETLPKNKRKKHSTLEQLTLNEAFNYLSYLIEDADNVETTAPNKRIKDELNAHFNK